MRDVHALTGIRRVVGGESEDSYKINVFYKAIDSVLSTLSVRFRAIKDICASFRFLWSICSDSMDSLKNQITPFAHKYSDDVKLEHLIDETAHLKQIYSANISDADLKPMELLNKISTLRLEGLFPNICIALRVFITIPVSVASGERSFSKLTIVKSKLRNSSTQDRLVGLTILSIESDLSRSVNFDKIIDKFACEKARKVPI